MSQRSTGVFSVRLSNKFLLPYKFLVASAVALLSLHGGQSLAASVEHAYDELNRLVGTADDTGQAARYQYDGFGNLTSITRTGNTTPSILGFSPTSGKVGDAVAIVGTGFGAMPAENTVTFNGVAAVVTQAAVNKLVVAVPAGATSGSIVVTSPFGTATSSSSFTVITQTNPNAPTVTGFTPTIGVAGTAVTVMGTNFSAQSLATKIYFNQTAAASSSANSATSIATVVPQSASTGRIRVSTPSGDGYSSQDFIIPPTGIAAADIINFKRATVDGASQTLDINTASKVGLLVFDGKKGDYLSIQAPIFAANPAASLIQLEVYAPNGTRLPTMYSSVTYTLSQSARTVHLAPLPQNGTYSVYVKPGTATVSLALAVASTRTLVADGAALSDTRAFTGHTYRYTFNGTAGQSMGLMFGGLTISSGLVVYKPDGTHLTGASLSSTLLHVDLPTLPATGVYTAVVSASGAAGAYSVSLVSNTTAVLTNDGAGTDVVLTKAGQSAVLNFQGVAGSNLGLGIGNLVLSNGNEPFSYVAVSVKKPDGAVLANASCMVSNNGCSLNLPNLPASGSYSVLVSSVVGATGSFTATLSSDVAGALGSGAYSLNLPRPGQNGRLTFTGNIGDNLAVRFTDVAAAPSAQRPFIQINKPDGVLFASTTLSSAGGMITLPVLSVAGTYTVFVDPAHASTVSMKLSLDRGAPIVIDGVAVNGSTSVAGDSVRYVFNGTIGQNLGLGLSNLVLSPNTSVGITVYRPNGAQASTIGGGSCTTTSTSGCTVDIPNLPETGVYSIVVTPSGGATGSFSATLSSDITGVLTPGSPYPLSLPRPGQNARLTFSGSIGNSFALKIAGLVTAPANQAVSVPITRPDTSQIANASVGLGSYGTISMIPTLTVAGTYTVFISPNSAGSASIFKITVGLMQ